MDEIENNDEARKLIVGLGNPGELYRETRHNFGFWVIDELARRIDVSLERIECQAFFAQTERVDLAKPQTYMNRSGYSLRCLAERWSYDASNILVVYDEVSLPLGRLRVRAKGSPGGHRGMESVIENLRTAEVPRMRLGIAPIEAESEDNDLSEFVLGKFDDEELKVVEKEVQRAADACLSWLDHGVTEAMNRFNG